MLQELMDHVRGVADIISARAPLAVRAAKKAMVEGELIAFATIYCLHVGLLTTECYVARCIQALGKVPTLPPMQKLWHSVSSLLLLMRSKVAQLLWKNGKQHGQASECSEATIMLAAAMAIALMYKPWY